MQLAHDSFSDGALSPDNKVEFSQVEADPKSLASIETANLPTAQIAKA
mgnify:CR=1 FL=1